MRTTLVKSTPLRVLERENVGGSSRFKLVITLLGHTTHQIVLSGRSGLQLIFFFGPELVAGFDFEI
jgi:hypothetical protein